MPVEEILLTARFKVDLADVDEATISEIHRLFAEYHELRQKNSILPSHYIYTAGRPPASTSPS
jgi:hypothetical protein